MANILQKWNTSTETWDDLSEFIGQINIDVHLDIFGVREIEYDGQTLTLDDSNTIESGDYIRYGTDDSPVNYQSIIQEASKFMNDPSDHYWIDGDVPPTWDVDTTVSGKMYFDASGGGGTGKEIKLNIPNQLTAGFLYRVKVKLRLNTSGGTDAIRFGSLSGGAGEYVEFTPDGTEQTYQGTFTPATSGSYLRDFFIFTYVTSLAKFEIDEVELFIESDNILFSGYTSKLIHKLKAGRYEFDLPSEIEFLKQKDIPKTLVGDNLIQRLYYALPDDYVIVLRNFNAYNLLNIYPTDFDTITYPGDEVTGTPEEVIGTDSNNYRCISGHTANAIANKPITGVNWDIYWEEAGSNGQTWVEGEVYSTSPVFTCSVSHRAVLNNQPCTGVNFLDYWLKTGSTGGTWVQGTMYVAAKFSDLLFDTLLIANADTFGDYVLYCVVVNKEIRFYGVYIGDTATLISNQYIEECEESEDSETVVIGYRESVNDDLRGEGSISWGNELYGQWTILKHILYAAYEKKIMDLTGCARPGGGSDITGFVTSIEKSGAIYKYELLKLTRIP